MPPWVLSLSYWLHMVATVLWLGGLAAIQFLILPLAAANGRQSQAEALAQAQRRLDPLAWFSLALLIITGLVQMSANPNYQGFLAYANTWAAAILLKHIVFLGMTALSAYLTWTGFPALQRALLRRSLGKPAADLTGLQRRIILLMRLNLILGVIVLVFTAVARAAS